jgi:hypothetical protein
MDRQELWFWTRSAMVAVLALILGLIAHTATAATKLVQNPYFAITGGSDATSLQFGTGCGTNCNGLGNVADWTTSGYNFVYLPNTSDTVGGTGSAGNVKLWGPNNDGTGGGCGRRERTAHKRAGAWPELLCR